jgi:hypothetical protein
LPASFRLWRVFKGRRRDTSFFLPTPFPPRVELAFEVWVDKIKKKNLEVNGDWRTK